MEERKRKIIDFGKKWVASGFQGFREYYGSPFGTLLFALFETTARGDKGAISLFEKVRARAGGTKELPKYLQSEDLITLAHAIGFYDTRMEKGGKGLLELDRKFNLRGPLSHIENPRGFYNELKKVNGFGGKQIRPWAACELVRLWEFSPPLNLELAERTEEKLAYLDLKPSDFKVEEYPYVDAGFEYIGCNNKSIIDIIGVKALMEGIKMGTITRPANDKKAIIARFT